MDKTPMATNYPETIFLFFFFPFSLFSSLLPVFRTTSRSSRHLFFFPFAQVKKMENKIYSQRREENQSK